jgi:predicted Rdx family selenoprotein
VAELNGTGHSAEMTPGSQNQFDVEVEGALLFSKERAGRFPDAGEILAALP